MPTRRHFNQTLITGLGTLALAGLPNPLSARPRSERSLGVALVGLGSYSEHNLAPSLLETEYCHLAGIVTGTPEKAVRWKAKYQLAEDAIYSYDTFDTIAANPAIDVVYVVLPNALHAEYCIRAARAGKHVICEKPMAVSVEECDAIIDACRENDVKLQVGYRLHFEPYTQEIKRFVREGTYGEPQYVAADAAYRSNGNPDQWRLNHALSGGGALMNMGVYAIQAAIYGTGMLPTSVRAQEFSTRPDYFKDTDETITAQFTFPNGATGNIMTSHNINANRVHTAASRGWFELHPAVHYGPLSGRTSDGRTLEFPHGRHQVGQMDGFARHILFDEPNLAPGEMGRRDMVIVEAIYRSIAEGGAVQPL